MGRRRLRRRPPLGDRFVVGDFVQVDAVAGTARVRVNDVSDVAGLRTGEAYPFLDLYWGDRAILVLDRSRTWRQETFQPVDAVESFRDGQRVLTMVSTGQTGGSLVPGGWDHEHCEICYAKLSEREQPVGWISSKGEWLCNQCHADYQVPRSLAFVNVE